MDKLSLLGTTRAGIVRRLVLGPRTAVQLSADLGIQVSAARKHLDRLRESGLVDFHFERAGAGRPKKVFVLTEEGRELFPRRYDAVLSAFVSEVVRETGEPQAKRAFRRMAERLAKEAVPTPGSDPARLRQLTRGLANFGFEPSLSEHGGERTITSQNCPILRTARTHRELVCNELHAEVIRAATGVRDLRRGKWIVDGDPVCTHAFATRGRGKEA